jgi:hypothetical protein
VGHKNDSSQFFVPEYLREAIQMEKNKPNQLSSKESLHLSQDSLSLPDISQTLSSAFGLKSCPPLGWYPHKNYTLSATIWIFLLS